MSLQVLCRVASGMFLNSAREFCGSRARALTLTGLFVFLSALLTACPGSPPPEEIDFEGDPSILRGAWTGTVGGMVNSSVFDLAFSPDGQRLAVAASYGVFLYDVDTLEPSGELSLAEGKDIYAAVFDPSGSILATSGMNVSFWDASTGERLRTLTKVKNLRAFSRDLTMGATVEQNVGNAATVNVWDLATETLLNTFEVTTDAVAGARRVEVDAVAFSPDGRTLAIADASEKQIGRYVSTLKLWSLETGALEKTFASRNRSCSSIRSVVFSPDGQKVAFNDCDFVFSLVDVASGELLPMSNAIQVAGALAFSPNSAQLVTRRSGNDTVTLDIWDLDRGSLVGTLDPESGFRYGPLAFSADGSHVAAGDWNGTFSLWDVPSLKRLATLPELAPFKVSLALEATYVDEISYIVKGSLTTEAGEVYKLEGTANSGTEHRYIRPAHAGPTPPTFGASVFNTDGTLRWVVRTGLEHDSVSYQGIIEGFEGQTQIMNRNFSMERP